MAKSKRVRASGISNCGARHGWNDELPSTFKTTPEAVERYWSALPPQTKSFILDVPDDAFSLPNLVDFWSRPENVQWTRGDQARAACGSIWCLALASLRRREYKEARALTINGSFIHQCCNVAIEDIEAMLHKTILWTEADVERNLPCFFRGVESTRSSYAMEIYIQRYTAIVNMKGYVTHLSSDWKSTSSQSDHRSSSSQGDDAKIKITFVHNADQGRRHDFDISSLATLKFLFNRFANEQGISLRSTRFSYMGKALFLSSAGNKTPDQLGMQDGDVINVNNVTQAQESRDGGESIETHSGPLSPAPKSSRTKKRANKRRRGEAKRLQRQGDYVKTMEDHKVEHSKRLTKIHEEAECLFKAIRRRLNDLAIKRSHPKRPQPYCLRREPHHEPKGAKILSTDGLGGKAGRSHFVVHVGEAQNLYKTANSSSSLSPLATLDLHGCTREEALGKLDEGLKTWVAAAMQGSYPFVRPVVIVCGCGSQVLSEIVRGWIKSNERVSNAPRLRLPKQGSMLRAA